MPTAPDAVLPPVSGASAPDSPLLVLAVAGAGGAPDAPGTVLAAAADAENTVTVSGSLTDGTDAVVFPTLYASGEVYGRPIYTEDPLEPIPLWNLAYSEPLGKWSLQGGLGQWDNTDDGMSPPAEGWVPLSPATGTPVLVTVTDIDAPEAVLPAPSEGSAPTSPGVVIPEAGGGSAPTAPGVVLAAVGEGSAPDAPALVLAETGADSPPLAPVAVLGMTGYELLNSNNIPLRNTDGTILLDTRAV